jgi:hypothetical protein
MALRAAARAMFNLTLLVALAVLMGCPQQTEKPGAGKGPSGPTKLEGTWQGTLGEGPVKLRLVVSISKSNDGTYSGIIDSIDQSVSFPLDSITFAADKPIPSLRFTVSKVQAIYEGTLSKDRSQFEGAWTQNGATSKLIFARAK